MSAHGIGNGVEYKCGLCGQEFSLAYLLRSHMKYHFRCRLCEDQPFLRTRENYEKHTAEFHPEITIKYDLPKSYRKNAKDTVKDYLCHLCPQSFERPYRLKRHLVAFHNEAPYNIIVESKKGPKRLRTERSKKQSSGSPPGNKFVFPQRGKKSDGPKEKRATIRRQRKTSSNCSDWDSSDDQKVSLDLGDVRKSQRLKTKEEKMVNNTSSSKNKIMVKNDYLDTSINNDSQKDKTAVKNEIFECGNCSALFGTQTLLDSHEDSREPDSCYMKCNKFACDKCEKRYPTKQLLDRHVETKHVNKKNSVRPVIRRKVMAPCGATGRMYPRERANFRLAPSVKELIYKKKSEAKVTKADKTIRIEISPHDGGKTGNIVQDLKADREECEELIDVKPCLEDFELIIERDHNM